MKIQRTEKEVSLDFEGHVMFVKENKPLFEFEDDAFAYDMPRINIKNAHLIGIPKNKMKRIAVCIRVLKTAWRTGK